MAKPKAKRLHSDDARMLRALLLDVVAALHELQSAVGFLQNRAVIGSDVLDSENHENVELIEN